MQVDCRDGLFIVSCTFEERLIPRAAGFQWSADLKRWVTRDHGVAVSLGQDKLTQAAQTSLGLNQRIPVPDGLEYLPFQEAGIDFARRRSRTLIADVPGLGKGHPLSTPILTPGGWVPIGDLKHGDKVIGWFGKPIPVTGIFDRGILPVFTVNFSDGVSIKCDADHLWTVCQDDEDGGRLMTIGTLDLIRRLDAGELLSIPTLLEPAQLDVKLFKMPPLVAGIDQARSHCIDVGNFYAYPEKLVYDVRDYALAAPHQSMEFLKGIISSVARIRGDDGHIQVNIVRKPESHDLVWTITQCVRALGGLIFVEERYRRYRLRIYLPEGIAWASFGYDAPKLRRNRRWKNFVGEVPQRAIINVVPSGREQVRCIKVDGPGNLYTAEHFIVTHNTVQAVGLVNALPQVQNALIIPPASLKKNWLREMTKWLVDKSMSVDICDGDYFPNSNVVIINYDILARHHKKLRERVWDLVVPDEHHYAKNPTAKRTIELHGGVVKIADPANKNRKTKVRIEPIPAKRLLMLSGTPLPNRTGDLWTTVAAADPHGLGRDFETFHKRYCGAFYDMSGKFVTNGEPDPAMLAELNKLLKERFMIRRLKHEVLKDLPPKIRQIIPLPADGLKKKIEAERQAMTDLLDMYEKMIGVRKEMSDEDLVNAVFRIRPETWEKYARMVDGDMESVQLPLTRLASARQDLAIAKLPMVIEYVGNLVEQGVKVGMFGYHQAVIEGLLDAFPKAACIYGKTPMNHKGDPPRTRQAQQDRFQDDPACRWFIGQYTAAGTGWTLTKGNHFVAAELTYGADQLLQAEDRFHRIGSEIWDTVWAHHLVVEGSLDDSMILKLIRKMEISELALD